MSDVTKKKKVSTSQKKKTEPSREKTAPDDTPLSTGGVEARTYKVRWSKDTTEGEVVQLKAKIAALRRLIQTMASELAVLRMAEAEAVPGLPDGWAWSMMTTRVEQQDKEDAGA